jgi:hypothetical protein
MDTAAIEAKDRSKTNAGPLRALHSAFHAFVITRDGLDNQLVRCAHLHHGYVTLRYVTANEDSRRGCFGVFVSFKRDTNRNAAGGTKNSPNQRSFCDCFSTEYTYCNGTYCTV